MTEKTYWFQVFGTDIYKYEVEKTSTYYVWFYDPWYGRERRALKSFDWYQTFEEAKAELVRRIKDKIVYHKALLKVYEKNLEKAETMLAPKKEGR